ncbi:ATP synthase subunit I [Rhodovulum marinum]|uniref:F1-F0 ATPase (N-ATPase) AtpR subunit n=1 Tax=Rhodovulum marinum TaxID=320662 RepID=A0A4R2PSJ9_9RHOB|nr:ATP synthase subunit I [Rhodovulum marinum]TCP38913.1 F1-F0 ATPase (N-ATPase) AtpR subunit [Rhodovulum marinum]
MTIDWGLVGSLVLSLGIGAAFGAVYLRLLWHSTQGIAAAGGAGRLILGFALRMALALGVLGLALWAGAGAGHLLAGLLGFVLVRQLVLRRR